MRLAGGGNRNLDQNAFPAKTELFDFVDEWICSPDCENRPEWQPFGEPSRAAAAEWQSQTVRRGLYCHGSFDKALCSSHMPGISSMIAGQIWHTLWALTSTGAMGISGIATSGTSFAVGADGWRRNV